MAKLPTYKTNDLSFQLMQDRWSATLDPLLSNPVVQGIILKSVPLTTGANTVSHLLGRRLQGWYIVRQRAAASIYDTQDANQMPDLTLQLQSTADVVVDLAVF